MPLLTEAFRAYSGWRQSRLRRMNPVEAQRETLMRMLRQAESTRFGRAHGFSGIQSVSDFLARVPLRRYEDFWNEYWNGPFPVLRDITWPGQIPFGPDIDVKSPDISTPKTSLSVPPPSISLYTAHAGLGNPAAQEFSPESFNTQKFLAKCR